MAYNTSKIAGPNRELSNSMSNYKALSIQKQSTTMLKTGDGVAGQEEVYLDPCAFVYYVVNPWRSSPTTGFIGWFRYTITYTFSGLKRPGLSQHEAMDLPIPRPLPYKPDSDSNDQVMDGFEQVSLTKSQYGHILESMKKKVK